MTITVNFDSHSPYLYKQVKFECTTKTKVKDLLNFLLDIINFKDDPFEEYQLLQHFSFININNIEQKAQLNYPLQKFLINFKYNLDNIHMVYFEACGIGAFTELEELARITINSSEKSHQTAHVHISRPNRHSPCYRIALNTMTQMKGDSKNWNTEFNNKERKQILSFLKNNQALLIDYYNRSTKGEYITEDYILYYGDQKYIFVSNRTY